jgi:YVTN family beta-propeller protein
MSVGRSTESLIGSELAGYRIEALIGRGGMGAVYRAQEAGLERKVALKVIAPELAQDTHFRDRFLRESQIAASLDHPHVIPILKAGEEDGLLFLAMRYVEGTDLAQLLAKEGALEPRRAVQLLEQVAEALDAAHELGLVHRDVKPSNVLIASAAGKEHCYLADFGLTKRTTSLSGVSALGQVVGTLEYVAPEQITGDPLDVRSDVYSLGCVIYECLTGQAPLPRATDVALLWAHVHEEPPPPSKAKPELPRELDSVLARALAKEPARRYGSAGELVQATRTALGIGETPRPHRTTQAAARVLALPRRRLYAGAALIVVLVAAVAIAVFALGQGSGGVTVAPNSVAIIDPESNKVTGSVQVQIRPGPVAVGAGSVWVGNLDDRSLSQIDPATRAVVANPGLEATPTGVATGAGAVWIANGILGTVSRLDPTVNAVVMTIDVTTRTNAGSVAFGEGGVWAAFGTGEIGQIDPSTNRLVAKGVAGVTPSAVAVGEGSVWVANAGDNTVSRVNPRTASQVRAFTVGQRPLGVAVGAGAVWVANEGDDSVWRIDAASTSAVPIHVGKSPTGIAFGAGAVWVANAGDGTVSKIDPATNEVVKTITLGNRPSGITVGDGAVWVTVQAPID